MKLEKRRGSWVVSVPLVLIAGMALVIVLMLTILWSIWREPETHLSVRNPGELHTLLPSIVGLTQSSLDAGNRVEVLQNGDGFFPPLLRDIGRARQSVHVETFVWWEGKICEELAKALAAAARRGVEVRLLVDASGGRKMSEELDKLMTDAGVRIARFHPIRISNIGRINNRDHRKLMIIDGVVGYTGGFGIAQEWTGNAQDRDHWRDTGVRVEGPVVARMQAAFAENWIEETGEILAGDLYFPKQQQRGSVPAHVAYTSPAGSVSSVQVLHYLAIQAARREVLIQNPYLLPDENTFHAIRDAVKRGVAVRIMVPSTEATDAPIVQHASHHHFGTLLNLGAKLYEYDRTLLHQKVLVVDGRWSLIGSTNFDDRSFQLNDEISMGFLDDGVAAQLRAAFFEDLKFAREVRLSEWKSRQLWHKTIDGLAYLAEGQL